MSPHPSKLIFLPLSDWLGCPQAAQASTAATPPPTATGPAGHLLRRHHLLLEPGSRWQPSPPSPWPAAPPPQIPGRKLQRQHRRRLRLLHGERLLRLGNAQQQPSDAGDGRRSNGGGGGVLYDVIGGGGDLYDFIGGGDLYDVICGGGDIYDVIGGGGGLRRVRFAAVGTSAMGSERWRGDVGRRRAFGQPESAPSPRDRPATWRRQRRTNASAGCDTTKGCEIAGSKSPGRIPMFIMLNLIAKHGLNITGKEAHG
jgi:hypothetical protein